MADHVVMPAAMKIKNGVTAGSLVDKTNFALRITRNDEIGGQLYIAITQWRRVGAPSAICDAVTNEKDRLTILKEKF